MKYLLWQFSAYAAVALALGVVVGRWSMSARVAGAERERQRAAYELSTLTVKASSLLEEAGRERSSIVDANGRLADDLRRAREAQSRIETELQEAELLRTQSEQALQTVGERLAMGRPSEPEKANRSEEVARLTRELATVRAELARHDRGSAAALAGAEARAKSAEAAHLELSRTHAALVRSSQVELTRALLRADRAESLARLRAEGGSRSNGSSATVPQGAAETVIDQIVDLRPYDRVDQLQDAPVD